MARRMSQFPVYVCLGVLTAIIAPRASGFGGDNGRPRVGRGHCAARPVSPRPAWAASASAMPPPAVFAVAYTCCRQGPAVARCHWPGGTEGGSGGNASERAASECVPPARIGGAAAGQVAAARPVAVRSEHAEHAGRVVVVRGRRGRRSASAAWRRGGLRRRLGYVRRRDGASPRGGLAAKGVPWPRGECSPPKVAAPLSFMRRLLGGTLPLMGGRFETEIYRRGSPIGRGRQT